uniref:Methyltransferase-like protein 5 isoform X3 n=1 Tax=Nicotiana sylvestris TaxID=4096 RepID=A0A1U7WC86_NICSY|nr:PREDICTED: methyltransferase-like protein 5 isoform X3 [Nicotiana sylvestris]
MKLKQLEGLLGSLEQFSSPKIELEQYPTGAHIASRMLYTADNSFEDVNSKVVADFGCGCGTLGLAAGLLGAGWCRIDACSLHGVFVNRSVIGLDIDTESLEIASANADELEVVETVVMNPPFGTRRKGADMEFLSAAMKVASQAVYSLHKTTTREHVKRAALRDYHARTAEVICELRYDVPQLYKFHKKKEVDIAVDLWRLVPQRKQERSL